MKRIFSHATVFICFLLFNINVLAQSHDTTYITNTNFGDIEDVIDNAADGDIIQFNPDKEIAFPRALYIKQKITIRGLNGRQKDADDMDKPNEKDKYSLLIIESEGVTIENFVLTGYYDADREDRLIDEKYKKRKKKNPKVKLKRIAKNNPYEKHKHALINVSAGGFTIQNGILNNSLKDGIMINPNPEISQHINGGHIKNITGYVNHKDVISIGGNGANGLVKNLVVENITCRNSKDKGAVEVSDGTRNTTVRNVNAYFSPYAIDIQDHYNPKDDKEKRKEKEFGTNRTVIIENVYAYECEYGLKTANHDLKSINKSKGHSNLSIDSLTAIRCAFPIQISNTEGVKIRNVCIEDGEPETEDLYIFNPKNPRISLKNCQDKIILENINIKDADNLYTGKDLKVNNCTDSKELRKTKITHNDCAK